MTGEDGRVIDARCVLGAVAAVNNCHVEQYEIVSHAGRSKTPRYYYDEPENQCGESAINFDGPRR